MLPGRKPRVPRAGGWFERKTYTHFDVPWTFEEAAKYVTEPENIRNHEFLPFIAFTKTQRRFTRKHGGPTPKPSSKSRPLAMASHVDGYVFAWYSHQLSKKYEVAVRAAELHDCVLAYRPQNGTNITMAEAAFSDIAQRGACVAVALDLQEFFPSIDHATLKANWARILGTVGLPPDHFAVFRAMTSFAEVDRKACLERLGIDPKKDRIPRPICNGKQFRDVIRRGPAGAVKMVTRNDRPHGIPQGSPISALLSNIYMLDFDARMQVAAAAMEGSYRRYSDDILFIVDPLFTAADVVKVVEDGLALLGCAIRLNAGKTESARFSVGPNGRLGCDSPNGIQYLGFTFDGERRLIRSQTMSKYARRLVYAVRGAQKAANKAGAPAHRRAVYRQFSHLGKSNFISRYVKAAKAAMPGDGIRRQVRRHMMRISDAFGGD